MIKDRHGFWYRNSVRALFLAAAVPAFSLSQVQASTYPNATALGIWRAALSGPTTRISGSNTGATIASRADGLPSGNGWIPAGNYGVAPGTNGAVRIGGAGTVSVGGKSVPVDITGSLSQEVISGAIAGCLTGSIIGCVIGTATPLALAYVTSSGGLRVTGGGAGGGAEATDSAVCSVGPCYGIRSRGIMYPDTAAGLEAACQAYVDAQPPEDKTTLVKVVYERVECQIGSIYGTYSHIAARIEVPAAPNGGTWHPATSAEIKAALIKAGPPDPRIVPELERNGVDWNKRWPGFDSGTGTPDGSMGSPNITGPSSIKGDTTTTTNSDGSRTTTTTTTPITYGPGTVTAGPSSSTTTTTNADGSIRNTSTTTTTPGEGTPAGEEEKPPVDPCDEHPDRVGCLDIDVPEGEIPKETKNVTFDVKPLPGVSDGQCPADVSMSFGTMPALGSAKIIDWRTFCDMALPLRSIVMALAAIMAFFIVMPGGRVE